ncbi:SirB1 family protein [Rhodovastum atsumiense]|uniref:Tetratricopeptide repeat protein n=1 Tax=Rhodovastum atsumiense TaxID=504468 RepID=A0A5M6IY30_9PROT|nr:transglutaminase-like domain-containing protein [Rhodovastum atsumiense]KAA5613222.1 tetratricopeptide repeat protein [Rhodovastum atsumiense]
MSPPRQALDAIGHLPDPEIDIADAALQFARVDAPEADWQEARAHLSELARDAVAVAHGIAEDDLVSRANALAALITGRHRYQGDANDYDNLDNANLIRVIARRRGLPVALGILWLHAARAAGWGVHGVDFPGHFLVALEGSREQVVLDVFAGGAAMDGRELRALLKRVEGPQAELRPGVLAPMSQRAVLLRLQNNIKIRRLHLGDVAGALACTEDMLRIAPDTASLWREAGLMNEQLDRVAAALRCFETFLGLVPEGEAAVRTRAAVEALRSRLN